jgi:hypothetical protein
MDPDRLLGQRLLQHLLPLRRQRGRPCAAGPCERLCAISNARPVRALPCKRALQPRGHKPPRNGELARFSRKNATCPTGPLNRDALPQNFPGVNDGAGWVAQARVGYARSCPERPAGRAGRLSRG